MLQVSKTVGHITITAEEESTLELFKSLAMLEEAFAGNEQCGKCNSTDLKYVWRVSESEGETYEYPDLVCQECKAKLHFGQSKDGSVYSKRFQTGKKGKTIKDSEGKSVKVGANGWLKYNFEKKIEE